MVALKITGILLLGKQAHKNRLQALEQALLATSTACCAQARMCLLLLW